MEASTFERFLGELRSAKPADTQPFTISAERYREPTWLERERAVFRGPRIFAASSQVTNCLPIDLPGASALLVRDAAGTVRAFANACRHRGTRLVDAPCAAKALVCPYHGWTYDLDGTLRHVPHANAFAGHVRSDVRVVIRENVPEAPFTGHDAFHGHRNLVQLPCVERHDVRSGVRDVVRENVPEAPFTGHEAFPGHRNLVQMPCVERHGLVWLGESPAALDADLAALKLDEHVLYRRARATRRCNWKLVIEAFLDGYHIRVLHRDSIYRFFLDAASVAEPVGPHIRAVTARRALRDGIAGDPRLLGTPSFVVFPATVIIAHPDFVSVITVHPLAPDVTDWDHLMLIPRERAGEAAHWAKSWQLIEETVFQREDLWVCEQIQKSIMTGATDELLFGTLEEPVRWFHAALDAALL